MPKIRAMSANIYRTKKYGDCSNHGISEKYDEILYACPDGCEELDTDNLPENFCELVKRELFGEPHWYFAPYHLVKAGRWVMAGGTFVSSSDTRFRETTNSWNPIPLHDRVEN